MNGLRVEKIKKADKLTLVDFSYLGEFGFTIAGEWIEGQPKPRLVHRPVHLLRSIEEVSVDKNSPIGNAVSHAYKMAAAIMHKEKSKAGKRAYFSEHQTTLFE